MTTAIPVGDHLKKAIQWIDNEKKDCPGKRILKMIDEAGMRFNLTPNDTDFLVRMYVNNS
jgi:hypothetical protein